MKIFNFKISISIVILVLALASCSNTGQSDKKDKTQNVQDSNKTENKDTKQEITKTNLSNLDFLKDYNNKYPYEVKLFENTAFTQRLKKLLGESRYKFLKETWAVETPMEYANDIFVASGCQAHNCGSTNFIVVVDFSKNVMYAGIREEDKIKAYSEDGNISQKVSEWENGN